MFSSLFTARTSRHLGGFGPWVPRAGDAQAAPGVWGCAGGADMVGGSMNRPKMGEAWPF